MKNLKNELSSPLPRIAQITNDGLVKIQFSSSMIATKEELKTILNSTVYFNDKTMRILTLKLSNPNGVSSEVSNFTWSVVSYEGSQLVIKLKFGNPVYVSAYSNKDSLQV